MNIFSDFFDSLPVKILSAILAFLVLVILAGTAAVLASGKVQQKNSRTSLIAPEFPDKNTTSNIEFGRLRTITKSEQPDAKGSPLIITPWISYSSTDRAFFEELAQKNLKIKATVTSYFSAKSKTELLSTEEKTIKSELLDEINAQLVLGKITGIFFSEYIFLD